MKIVILDGYTTNPGDLSWDFLNEFGTYTVYDRTPKEKIVERAQGCDIIITNKTPIDARTIAALPELKFITLLSTGFNVVDVDFEMKKEQLMKELHNWKNEDETGSEEQDDFFD